jgi:RNA-directed DNA polymerase
MEGVVSRLTSALVKVASNKGAPGPDGQTIEVLCEQWLVVLPRLAADLLSGRYVPGVIRRVLIPKAGGGQRGLGIPDVVDRVVQEAVRQVLEPCWEPTFHPSSHGFRPGRSCHTAIAEAKGHLEDGYEWVVDLDLEKFFDLVCHQRLLAKLAGRIQDRRLLVLIGRMLKAGVVLPDGVVIASEQGVPQGGPLSPLLSNIVLDELDAELDRRGHRFVRYADDANVYVRSERAGVRVMASLTEFIRRRLRLKVNEAKSAVARPEDRHFLGFRLRVDPQTRTVEVLLSERTMRLAMQRVRQLTPRNWGFTLLACIARINAWLRGWHGFFGIASVSEMQMMRKLDAHIRRRLRAILLRHWKRKRTIVRHLIALVLTGGQRGKGSTQGTSPGGP